MNTQEIIDGYNELRDNCLFIAKGKPELFGEYAWLQFAILDSDITMAFTDSGIECYGSVYTSQTCDNEFFEFVIPFSELGL